MNKDQWFTGVVLGGLTVGWIAPAGFGKTRLAALFHLYRKLPADIDLPPMTIFVPSLNSGGEFLLNKPVERSFIYLSPNLEFSDQPAANFLVAHELAHCVLQHGDAAETHDAHEAEADALALSWGFEKAAPGERHEKLLELWKES